jgi:S1-C subfamily serine protease
VDEVNRVVPQLIRSGKVTRPGLGVQVATDQIAEQLGLKGVLIIRTVPGGAAARAGLRSTTRDASGQLVLGDIITAVNGAPVQKTKELFTLLARHKAGEEVTLKILRDDEEREVKVTLVAVD